MRDIQVGPDGHGAEVPLVDEHTALIDADPGVVWRSLTTYLTGWDAPATRAYAHLVAAVPGRTTGAFPSLGSALPGFRVSEVDPPSRLVLDGGHHFSNYRLEFLLDAHDGGTLIRARSYAAFPGVLGSLYRLAVIRTGAHRLVTRRLLRWVGRMA